ncbi:MAG: DUF1598 domain-containing protein [Planctomycetaceae bacterium]|nr:DUF1598 domain-containing protein [Planctomycetaceae bacterium]
MATRLFRGGFLPALLLFATAARGQDNGNNPVFIGNLPATTVQLPTFGVSIDAEGTLETKLFREFDRQLLLARLAAAKGAKQGDVWAAAKLRKVSLVRLERAIAAEIAAGRQPDDVMRSLAGLTRVQYVFCFPAMAGKMPAPRGQPGDGQSGDIVIAGPAEPWALDPAGRAVGLASGRPVLQLDDLAVALRAFPPDKQDRPFLGCSIDPPPEGLARLVEFQKTVPRQIRDDERAAATAAIAKGTSEALGSAEIRVFGISPRTHFAHVLVEADYRMKRIGIGAETPPVKMTTFLSALNTAPQGTLQRWWFTPDYKCVKLAPDKLAAQLVGQGVQLWAEDKLIGEDGSLKSRALLGEPAVAPKPNKASELFTLSFTRKYPEIAAASPVYAQMRSLIDLAISAALIRRLEYYTQAGWTADTLRDERALPVETLPQPRRVPCVVNSLWKGNRLLTPAGGGVSIRPDEALLSENLLSDEDGALAKARGELTQPAGDRWWWD